MLGPVIGDIVGSIYEFDNIRAKGFPLFSKRCEFTDDTVMSLAVAKALLDSYPFDGTETFRRNLIRDVKALARAYPHPMGGYGNRFSAWVRSDGSEPYNSWGNGAAMRVAACGFAAESIDEALALAKTSAAITHNHPEGIAGAQIVAACIYLICDGAGKDEIKAYVEETYCKLDVSVDEYRQTYKFTERCSLTVPPAIRAFLEADGFEDAIRNAVSVGGDSDTLAAITGGLAEAYFRIPEDIAQTARSYLTPDLLDILDRFEATFQK